MNLILANPWGLTGLLALPLLVAIHSLRQRARRVATSTLFLLEHAGPEPVGGLRLDAFRQSVPFWMQAVAALAATWLLVEPRFIRSDSRQTIAVVLDSSASMAPFRADSIAALDRALRRLGAVAGRTDWHLLETGPRRPPLHAGNRLDDLLGALSGWRPTLGTHDPGGALAIALSLAPPDRGAVILVTDRPRPVPSGVAILSVGRPIDNVGISAADVVATEPDPPAEVTLRWRTLVTNHGTSRSERTLSLVGPGSPSSNTVVASLALDPGQSRTVEGPWPAGADRLVLGIDADRFPLDDRAALMLPRPRIVRVAVRPGVPGGDLLGRMLAAASDTEIVAGNGAADAVDLLVATAGDDGTVAAVEVRHVPPRPSLAEGAASGDDGEDAPAIALDPTPLAAGDHPLVRDLAWRGLLSGPAGDEPLESGDEVLVWKGDRPFIRLRARPSPDGGLRETLLLDFDVERSSAARTPALVVLLGRFADRVRQRIDRPWAGTFQTGAPIEIPTASARIGVEPLPGADGDTTLAAPRETAFHGRAPDEPGFFTVRAGDDDSPPLLAGAVQQGDARQSDFSAAAPADTVEELRLERARRQSVADPFLPGWLALAAAALATAWAWPSRGTTNPGTGSRI